MKTFFRIFILTILIIFGMSFAATSQTNQGPFNAPQMNSTKYVGSTPGWYPTIQSAVTSACVSGKWVVSVPVQYAGADLISAVTGGCTTARIEDSRTLPQACYTWSGSAYTSTACYPGTGSGVSTVSVATANGFQGSSSGGSNPALTLDVDSTHFLPTNTGSSSSYLNGAGAYTTPSISGSAGGALAGTYPNPTIAGLGSAGYVPLSDGSGNLVGSANLTGDNSGNMIGSGSSTFVGGFFAGNSAYIPIGGLTDGFAASYDTTNFSSMRISNVNCSTINGAGALFMNNMGVEGSIQIGVNSTCQTGTSATASGAAFILAASAAPYLYIGNEFGGNSPNFSHVGFINGVSDAYTLDSSYQWVHQIAIPGLSAGGMVMATAPHGELTFGVPGTDYQAPISLTTAGSGAATFISNVLNIPTPVGFANPMTARGDMIYGDTAGAPTRLAPNITLAREFLVSLGSGTVGLPPMWNGLISSDIPNNGANTTGQSGTVNTIAGNVTFSTGLGVTGSGTIASPYVVTASGGGYTPPTGTGFVHITAGSQDGAARAVDLSGADVSSVLPISNGGLGLGTSPISYQILQAQNSTQYAPETVNGDGSLAVAGQLIISKSANLKNGALGSVPYQSAADATSFIASPTTTGHTFFYGWQPSGSAIAPAAIDGATYLASPPAIGGTSPASGAFTSLTLASGTPLTSQSSANSQIVTCPTGGTTTQYCGADGAWHAASGSPAFSALTSGTNTTAAMLVGSGASLAATGTGIIAATAAPVAGITGLGTGVGTFLGTPTSANLAAALTDETGSGVAVFGTAPTISQPLFMGASGASTSCANPIASFGIAGTAYGCFYRNSGTNTGHFAGENGLALWTFDNPLTSAGTITSALGTAAITSATGAPGVTSVTCITANCTVYGGTYTVVGGTATTGTIVTLLWPTTATAWRCDISMNGGGTGASFLGLGHSVATATGMTVSAAVTVATNTFNFDYSCQP